MSNLKLHYSTKKGSWRSHQAKNQNLRHTTGEWRMDFHYDEDLWRLSDVTIM